jgi:hypothetical protein
MSSETLALFEIYFSACLILVASVILNSRMKELGKMLGLDR